MSSPATPAPGRRLGWLLATALPAALTLALVLLAALLRPGQPGARPVAEVGAVRSLTCPFLGNRGTLVALGDGLEVASLEGQAVADPLRPNAVTAPVTLTRNGDEPLAAGVLSREASTASWTECAMPVTSGGVVITQPATSELVLTNPDAVDALVNVALQGPGGPIASAGLRGITVPARSTVRVPVSVHTTSDDPVTATFASPQGRVVAVVRANAGGVEQAPTSAPARLALHPGIPPGASRVRAVVANTGEDRAAVTVDVLGPRGRFTPTNGTLSVPPHSTLALDLTAPINGQPVALSVSSDVPVLSMVEATSGSDLVWVAPTEPAQRLTDVAPAGTLQVANPSTAEARVRVRAQGAPGALTLPPGGVAAVQVGAGPVALESDHPVVAGVRATGAGLAVARVRATPETTVPSPGILDPGLGR